MSRSSGQMLGVSGSDCYLVVDWSGPHLLGGQLSSLGLCLYVWCLGAATVSGLPPCHALVWSHLPSGSPLARPAEWETEVTISLLFVSPLPLLLGRAVPFFSLFRAPSVDGKPSFGGVAGPLSSGLDAADGEHVWWRGVSPAACLVSVHGLVPLWDGACLC